MGNPVRGAVRAINLVGWRFVSANAIVTHDGTTLRLLEGSSAMLRGLFRARFRDWSTTLSARQHQQRHQHSWSGFGGDDHLDTRPFRRVMQSKARQSLSAREKLVLKLIYSGAYRTPADVLEHTAAGENCRFCGKLDTLEHRLHECSLLSAADREFLKTIDKVCGDD